MIRGRRLAVVLGAAVLLGALTTTASAQHVARGILFTLGEKLISELTPAGDEDTFVCYGVASASVSFTLEPLSEGFSPTVTMQDEEGTVLNLANYTKVKGTKTKVRRFPLPRTGPYYLRVTDPQGRTGQYRLKTKGNLAKVPRYPGVTIGPGETFDVAFGAGPGLEVETKIKLADRKKPVSILGVYDPDGEELPHGTGSFYKTSKGLASTLRIRSAARSSWRDDADRRRLGKYGLTIGGAVSQTTFTVRVKVRHAKGSGTRVVASTVPVITQLEPNFGRPGAAVVVHGANFLPGKLEVLFGEKYAREPTYLSSTTIAVRAPFGEGEVDVTVINSDGQEGVLEDAFIFIPNPPNIESVTPTEGPDSGGTVVNVYGQNMTYVETIKFGSTALAGSATVVADWHLRFTTEPMAPGTYTLELTDRFGQIVNQTTAFAFVAAPELLALSPEKGGAGRPVTCIGKNFRPDHTVLVDGVPTATTYVSPTALTWVTPPGAPGDKIGVGVRDIWGRTSTLATPYEYAWSEGLIEETFATNVKEDTAFTLTGGAKWNPATNPGTLVATWGVGTRNVPSTFVINATNVIPLGAGTTWGNYFCQAWYSSSEVGASGTISGYKFVTGTSSNAPGAVLSSFKVVIGHNNSKSLVSTRASNFAGTPVTVINSVSYTLPKSMSFSSPTAFPTFSKHFKYNGTSNLVVDISKTASSGSNQGWGYRRSGGARCYGPGNTSTSGTVSTNFTYNCVLDFRSATSMAQSLFYRTESDYPAFLDPIVSPTDQPEGTEVLIEYQGAKADPTAGTPDPLTYTSWTEDPTDLMDNRFLRFRVTFTANLDTEKGPTLDKIMIPYLYFD